MWEFRFSDFLFFDWSSHNSLLYVHAARGGISCGLVYGVEQDIILIIIDCCLQAKLPLGDIKALLSLHYLNVTGERLMENCTQLVTLFSVSLYLLRITLLTHITANNLKSYQVHLSYSSQNISWHLKVHCAVFGGEDVLNQRRKILNFSSKLKQTLCLFCLFSLFPWLNKSISKLTFKLTFKEQQNFIPFHSVYVWRTPPPFQPQTGWEETNERKVFPLCYSHKFDHIRFYLFYSSGTQQCVWMTADSSTTWGWPVPGSQLWSACLSVSGEWQFLNLCVKINKK